MTVISSQQAWARWRVEKDGTGWQIYRGDQEKGFYWCHDYAIRIAQEFADRDPWARDRQVRQDGAQR